jgi:hypothetical protein
LEAQFAVAHCHSSYHYYHCIFSNFLGRPPCIMFLGTSVHYCFYSLNTSSFLLVDSAEAFTAKDATFSSSREGLYLMTCHVMHLCFCLPNSSSFHQQVTLWAPFLFGHCPFLVVKIIAFLPPLKELVLPSSPREQSHQDHVFVASHYLGTT